MSEPLAVALFDLLRPELERLVDQRVAEKLACFTPPQPDPWMTAAEGARYLNLSPEAVRARCRRGTLPGHHDGTRWLLDRRELDAHLTRPSQNGFGDAATIQGNTTN
jgi:excisionase family DNA binding protein